MPTKEAPLVWIDLEMTGLDPDRCHILEIATVITNGDLEVIAEGPEIVIHATEEELETLSEWSLDQFTRSGLLERVRASTIRVEEAERQTLEFLEAHTKPRTSPLCGNSVHTDRTFLYSRMRRLHDFLHYRNVDVSSLKEVLRRWYPTEFKPPAKSGSHEARRDVLESVEELRYYRQAFFKEGAHAPK